MFRTTNARAMNFLITFLTLKMNAKLELTNGRKRSKNLFIVELHCTSLGAAVYENAHDVCLFLNCFNGQILLKAAVRHVIRAHLAQDQCMRAIDSPTASSEESSSDKSVSPETLWHFSHFLKIVTCLCIVQNRCETPQQHCCEEPTIASVAGELGVIAAVAGSIGVVVEEADTQVDDVVIV